MRKRIDHIYLIFGIISKERGMTRCQKLCKFGGLYPNQALFRFALLWLIAFTLISSLLMMFSSKALAAGAYPSSPIRIIVPTGPGGLNDPIAHFISDHFRKVWGQPGIVEHRPGAGGTIGTRQVVTAESDGYTLLLGNIGPLVLYPALNEDTPYDPLKDLMPVGALIKFTNILAVTPALQVESVQDLIELSKKQPGKLNFASSGVGQTMHLAGEMFKLQTGSDITHVPYKGTGPAIVDLIGGQVDMFFGNLPATASLVQSGKLRALAVTSETRNSALPDLPTMLEAGVPDFVINSWCGLFAPAGTPAEIVEKINAEMERAWSTPEGQAVLTSGYLDWQHISTGDFSTFLLSETKFWTKFIQQAGITAQ